MVQFLDIKPSQIARKIVAARDHRNEQVKNGKNMASDTVVEFDRDEAEWVRNYAPFLWGLMANNVATPNLWCCFPIRNAEAALEYLATHDL